MPEPKEFKRRSVSAALLGYTPSELMGLVRVIEGGENLSLSEIIDALTDGRFNLDGEDPQTREIHHQINGDLYLSFLDCIKTQQVDIDTVDISGYDYLKDSWDLRDDRARRLGKLKSLVFRNNMDDTDLLNAIRDLEDLYAE